MIKKKVITVLGDSVEDNSNLLNFIHVHFENCMIDAVYAKPPSKKLEKRIGDHFKTMVSNTTEYFNSNNKYKLLYQESIEELDMASFLHFYDIMMVSGRNYTLLNSFLQATSQINNPRLPVLVLPEKHTAKIQNVVFVSSSPENTIQAFKKFCYLFPKLCKESESILMKIDASMGPGNKWNEKLLYEYLKTKCEHLSVHKVHGELQNADKKAMNLSSSSLFVIDRAGSDLNNWLGKTGLEWNGMASFSMSA